MSTNTLLHQSHGELLVRDAVSGAAHVLRLAVGDVRVDAEQHVFETFGGVVHEAQLEALLVEEALRQRPAQGIRRQGCFR